MQMLKEVCVFVFLCVEVMKDEGDDDERKRCRF